MTGSHRKTYMTDRFGPLPFCPGCGHSVLLKALDKALVKRQPEPNKVVIVTDIGCIGLSCKYFETSALHGLHGRSITYACGLKLARPELMVIVLMGDGGCGIGGTHLLNVARRNIGIKLIVANNLNYGMTGGQHSVTTPYRGVTTTTPWGNLESPMDLCATVAAAGGSWVYRSTVFNRELPEIIAQSLTQPGFTMLDLWELCTAYYMPRNDLKKDSLLQLLDNLGFSLGLQAHNPRPEYSTHYRQVHDPSVISIEKKPAIRPKYIHKIKKQTGIIIAGSAGQKIKSGATSFSQGSIFAGLTATQKDDYPITVQTGHSVSEIVLSPETIDYTGIESPDFLVLLSQQGLSRVEARIEKLSAKCILITDESIQLPNTRAKICRYPLIKTAQGIGKRTITTLALAALLGYTGIFDLEAYSEAIRTYQKPDIATLNLKALDAGADLASRS